MNEDIEGCVFSLYGRNSQKNYVDKLFVDEFHFKKKLIQAKDGKYTKRLRIFVTHVVARKKIIEISQ